MTQSPAVLVVDDERGPRESLRAIQEKDYQVITAAEGQQALGIFERESVDIVLLDLRYAWTVYASHGKIKAADADIEVILVTEYASYETVLEYFTATAFDYIRKPFDIPPLRELVQRALVQRQDQVGMRQALRDLAQQTHPVALPVIATPTLMTGHTTTQQDFKEPLPTINECSPCVERALRGPSKHTRSHP